MKHLFKINGSKFQYNVFRRSHGCGTWVWQSLSSFQHFFIQVKLFLDSIQNIDLEWVFQNKFHEYTFFIIQVWVRTNYNQPKNTNRIFRNTNKVFLPIYLKGMLWWVIVTSNILFELLGCTFIPNCWRPIFCNCLQYNAIILMCG